MSKEQRDNVLLLLIHITVHSDGFLPLPFDLEAHSIPNMGNAQ